MVDGLALCSCACVTCLWCSLLAICFPKFLQKLQESDSNVCCGVNSLTRKSSSRIIGVCNPSAENFRKKAKKSRDPRFTVKIVRKTKPRQCILKNSQTGSNCEELYGELSSGKRDGCGYHPTGYENPTESGIQTASFDQREGGTDLTNLNARCSSDDLEGNRRHRVDERLVDNSRGYQRVVKKKSKKKSSPFFSSRYRPKNGVPHLIRECGNDRCRRFVYGDLYA